MSVDHDDSAAEPDLSTLGRRIETRQAEYQRRGQRLVPARTPSSGESPRLHVVKHLRLTVSGYQMRFEIPSQHRHVSHFMNTYATEHPVSWPRYPTPIEVCLL
jgi:hypothetical protein